MLIVKLQFQISFLVVLKYKKLTKHFGMEVIVEFNFGMTKLASLNMIS